MEQHVLCIGAGSMGGAVLRSALESGIWSQEQVCVVVRSSRSAEKLKDELHVETSTTLPNLKAFNVIILGVKPQVMPSILPLLQECKEGTLIISMAAGLTLEGLEPHAPQAEWVRVMPNTPVLVKAGLTAVTKGSRCKDSHVDYTVNLFSKLGKVIVCDEPDLDRLGALAGAGPGFLFTILDALANGGVAIGLSRQVALEAAAHTLYGSGLLAVETGKHPGELRDAVTSPGGTTIAGILEMERQGLRTAMSSAVQKAYERSNELGSKK